MSTARLPPSNLAAGPGRTARLAQVRCVDSALFVSAAVAFVIVLLATAASIVAPADPDRTDVLSQGLPLGAAGHLLGTDSLGRDILSRVLHGARMSLIGPFCVVVLAVATGVALAISAAWVGGIYDRISSRAIDVLFAFPSLLIAVLAVAVFGQGMTAPVLALAVAYTPYVARVVKSVAARERNLPYIDSCQLMGYSALRICIRHLLPNIRSVVSAQATILFANALVDLAAISFLGLGAQPPTSQWGVMVQDGSSEVLNGAFQQSAAASGAIVLTVVAFNVLGERLSARAARVQR